jgi:hypothetical protein
MKLVKNGIEIELTYAETRKVYELMRDGYIREDIMHKAEEMEVELTEEKIKNAVDVVNSGLEHNDSYWESYWMTIEYVIENLLKET